MADDIRIKIDKELKSLKKNADQFSSAVEIVDEAKKITNDAKKTLNKAFSDNKKTLKTASDSLEGLIQKQEKQLIKLQEVIGKLTGFQEELNEIDIPSKFNELRDSLKSIDEGIIEKLSKLKENDVKIHELLNNITSTLQTSRERDEKIKDELIDQIKEVQSTASTLNNDLNSNHKELKKLHHNNSSELTKIIKAENQELSEKISTDRNIMIALIVLVVIIQIVLFLWDSEI